MRQFLHRWLSQRARSRARLRDPDYAFLFEPEDSDEAVVFDTETTGLSRKRSDIISIAAIRIRGNRLLLSQRLELLVRPSATIEHAAVAVHGLRPMDVADGLPAREAVGRFLRFIGSRPLVGYYLEFDIAMINRVIRPWLGISLPNRAIEVSALYYDRVMRDGAARDAHYTGTVDLSFARILAALDLPALPAHDALNDALMTGLIYLKLTAPL
ncbi:MAG TPA: 3'-5' exonuclease [Acetobacteraceae bacterium]|nr:3'-5' exonuclease [Acetobacteraceae bacterium]